MPDSKLIDAAPQGVTLSDVVAQAHDYDLAVLHTSTPTFASDVKALEVLKAANLSRADGRAHLNDRMG